MVQKRGANLLPNSIGRGVGRMYICEIPVLDLLLDAVSEYLRNRAVDACEQRHGWLWRCVADLLYNCLYLDHGGRYVVLINNLYSTDAEFWESLMDCSRFQRGWRLCHVLDDIPDVS
jgi:hypothetical protein